MAVLDDKIAEIDKFQVRYTFNDTFTIELNPLATVNLLDLYTYKYFNVNNLTHIMYLVLLSVFFNKSYGHTILYSTIYLITECLPAQDHIII